MRLDAPQQSSPLRSHPVRQRTEDNEIPPRSRSVSNSTQPERHFDVTCGLFTVRASPLKKKSQHRQPHGATAVTPSEQAVVELRNTLGQEVLDHLIATGCIADDVFLTKWLQARGPAHAADAILAHLVWREEFIGPNPHGICETSIAEELAAKKIFLQGLDHHGCPVLLFLANRHVSAGHHGDPTLRLLAYAIDTAFKAPDPVRNPMRMVCCVFDLSGVKLKNIDVHFLLGVFDLLQKHYPQSLSRLYFIDAPMLFFGVWRCVTPFINPHTRAKITFLSGAAGRRQLAEAVGPTVLPQELGGSFELLPVDEAAATLRAGGRLPSAGEEENIPTNDIRAGASGVRILEWSLDSIAAAGRGARSVVVYPFRKFLHVATSGGGSRTALVFIRFVLFMFFLVQLFLLFTSFHKVAL